MDWTNNFYALVKDTETNIARAKNKLSGISDKALASNRRQYSDFISPNKLRSSKPVKLKSFETTLNYNYTDLNSFDDNLNLSMTSTQERQIHKMKEQIDSQNRTMEKLYKLINSLDQERDYYKQQISFLKEQVDLLTDKIDSNLSNTSNDWKMTKIKNEVMHEIDKMKAILQKYTQEVKQPSMPWSQPHSGHLRKESLVYNLDQIHDELNLMNKRLDRIESGHLTEYAKSSHGLERKSASTNSKNLRFLSPIYPDANAAELPKIRLAISSMNSKLNSLEKKLEAPLLTSSFNTKTSHQKTPETFSYLGKLSSEYIDDDDAGSSVSDLSSILSSTDEDVDDCYLNSKPSLKRSKRKYKSPPRVKLDLELSDLEISDEENLSLDTDYLDVKI